MPDWLPPDQLPPNRLPPDWLMRRYKRVSEASEGSLDRIDELRKHPLIKEDIRRWKNNIFSILAGG